MGKREFQLWDNQTEQTVEIQATQKGREYFALCPWHKDREPSLSINADKGLYFCHGCGAKGALYRPPQAKAKEPGPSGKIVKTYDYPDLEGNLLHQTVRYNPKSFKQRMPGNNGDWVWSLKGITPILYNLSDVSKAEEIIVVAGEKDCDNLSKLGFCSTTNACGEKAPWLESYTEALRGKDIILIPDNDTPGREHMTKVALALNGKAKSIKILELPGLPDKGDVSDWIETFDGDTVGAGESLVRLIDGAPAYEPEEEKTLRDVILDSAQFASLELPERKHLLAPWLKEDSITLISGWRGCGKTWFAMSILDAVSKGEAFGPWERGNSQPCLFLDGEMPAQDVIERIKALNINSARPNPFFIYSDAIANRQGLPKALLTNEKWRTEMKAILIANRTKLWVIDNLASLAPGIDENSKELWDPINQWLLELRFSGIATIMLHHMNKDGGQRGTSGREDNLDISISLKKPSDYTPEDGARFIAHFSKARVSIKDLPTITDTEFKLIQNEDEPGKYLWASVGVRKENNRAVLELINDGLDAKAICETLDLSKGYVSKIRKKLILNGEISEKGELTQRGYNTLHNA